MQIWDAIFADDPGLGIMDFVCVALLLLIRNERALSFPLLAHVELTSEQSLKRITQSSLRNYSTFPLHQPSTPCPHLSSSRKLVSCGMTHPQPVEYT